MKKLLLFTLIFAATCANALTIDFDDITVGGTHVDLVGDYYSASGINFSPNFTVEAVSIAEPSFYPSFLSQGGSGSNALVISNAWSTAQSIEIDFTNLIDAFQVDVFDTEVGSLLGSLVAFDSNGIELGSMAQITSSSMHGVLAFTANGIAKIRITTDSDGALFDNLTFKTSAVAEPSMIVLFMISLLALFFTFRNG